MVREKALSEPKSILEELNKKHAKILDAMEDDCELSRVHYLEGVYQKIHERQRKVISKAHSDSQNRILKKKNDLFSALKEDLKDEIRAITKSQKYADFLKAKVAETIHTFNPLDTLVIVVNSKDAAHLPNEINTKIDDDLLGGFYVLRNGSEKYDLTLDSEVNGLDAFLGCMMNTLYEITGEGCDDEG